MITVVITTFKREPDMVQRALNSVLVQTYRDIEIIVVDDSPNDYCFRKEVECLVLDNKNRFPEISISYIAHEKNLGACVARNTGIQVARGEYLAYLDDDDEWLPEKLEKQYRVMKASDAALVYCGYFCKNDVTGEIKKGHSEYYRGKAFDKLLYENFIGSTSFPLLRTEIVKKVGGFDSQMQSAQDYDLWLRIAENDDIDFTLEPLVIYHEHGGEQITTTPEKKIAGLERLNEKYKPYLDNNPRLWRRRNIVIAPYYAANCEMKKALSVWWKSVKHYPTNIVDNLKYLRAIIKQRRKFKGG